MLFNSYIFIFGFLPVTFCLYHFFLNKGRMRQALFILTAASLFYYSWWNPKNLLLIGGLMGFVYFIAKGMMFYQNKKSPMKKCLLILGITGNMAALGYFKYTNFIVDNINVFLAHDITIAKIILPIGISFFTFQKIALLVDVYYGKVSKLNFPDYALFVTFFPQLIAGPIVHHSEVMPQFSQLKKLTWDNAAAALTFFFIGLAKKVIIADTAARYSSPYFQAALNGTHLNFFTSWSAVLSYTVQIYFDFSAYSDMAIGLGLLFGIHLPINFNSPYKSHSIIDFWRRWHMTLSRFLRDYVYFSLGGNRKGPVLRYANLLLTMLIGGIWHGAGWTFLIWGVLHGTYLMINHGWHAIIEKFSLHSISQNLFSNVICRMITFFAVMTGWIFFRAENVSSAIDILKSMFGRYGFDISQTSSVSLLGLGIALSFLLIAWFMPNSQQIMAYLEPNQKQSKYGVHDSSTPIIWKPSKAWAIYTGILAAVCLMAFSQVSEFIYFQF